MSGLYVVKGADPVLRSRALHDLVETLLEGEDRSLVVEDVTIPGRAGVDGGDEAPAGREGIVSAAVSAAQSPPFMTARRIVVLRDYEHLTADDAAPLVAYLADPLDTTVLVFVSAGAGRVAKSLADALKGAESVGAASERTADVLGESLQTAGIRLQADATRMVTEHLGEDAGRVGALVEVLAAAYGPGASLGAAEVEPYLGEAGSVPAYQLTNAIEEGDVAGALEVLERLLTVTSPRQPKPMHPLQVMGVLQSRYRRLARLDDPAIATVEQAHAALGGKGSTFPAKKALEATRALGTDGLRRAVDALHRADLELKGASALPAESVVEVLVARLAGLSARSRPGARAGRR